MSMLVVMKRSRVKNWGVLFTCLTTRAIHPEIAFNLTSSSAIMATQRLVNRRGLPAILYSDNGTNFRGACNELSDELKNLVRRKLHKYALRNGMKSVFNPPNAPHTGSSWKRLVPSVKTALNAILRDEILTDEILYTVMTEVEHLVNSRLFTHIFVDPNDCEALTPNHFLIKR